MVNSGFVNERNFVLSIDKKKIDEIPLFVKEILKVSFESIDVNELFYADFSNCFSKPDISIFHKGLKSNWSIKFGTSDGMHVESIKSLILFLRSLGLSIKGQKTLLLYLNGDKTLDGTGKINYSAPQLVKIYRTELKELNKELNQPKIRDACIDRFLFKGREGRTTFADLIVLGTPNGGLYATKTEIVDYIKAKPCNFIAVPHIGPMTIQPYVRFKKKKYYKTGNLGKAQIKWKNLYVDFEKIRYGYLKEDLSINEKEINRRVIKKIIVN